jgi:hypothetical protein
VDFGTGRKGISLRDLIDLLIAANQGRFCSAVMATDPSREDVTALHSNSEDKFQLGVSQVGYLP